MFDLTCTCLDGANLSHTRVRADRLPDRCPICHFSIEPRQSEVAHLGTAVETRLEIVLQCPRQACEHFFIARYQRPPVAASHYVLQDCVPWEPRDRTFSDAIGEVSPDYCAIANQAQKAERQGWKLVAGPGYRKALEFLIKDYLCLVRPEDAETIKKAELGKCISNYVTNDKVKQMSARAAWLGNDETHYLRKWADKDLEDLKKLIELTVLWIEMEELTESVMKEMPERKK